MLEVILLSIFLSAPVVEEESNHSDPTCLLDMARVSEVGCCFDGRDNDNDGDTDHKDSDCRGPQ